MFKSTSRSQRERGEKAVVNGRSIPYSRSSSILGAPTYQAVSNEPFAGEALFHAANWNQQEIYNWTVPTEYNIDYISVVCVGGGGAGENAHDAASGAGGALAYKNNIPVTPGTVVTVRVGGGGANPAPAPNANAYDGEPSFIQINGVNYAVAGGGSGGSPSYTSTSPDVGNVPGGTWSGTNADGGGNGGAGSHSNTGTLMGGGGAGGYGGAGGKGILVYNYGVTGQATSPQPGSSGAGGGAAAFNGSEGVAGGGGVGVYGLGPSGDGGYQPNPSSNEWGQLHGRGGSTAHNTGLNGYPGGTLSAHPNGIVQAPTNHPSPTWGNDPPQYPNVYDRVNTTAPTPSWYGDGGFPGGGGGGGNGGSTYGRGGHGMVRIVYGTVGPNAQAANKRQFPTQNVDKTDEYAEESVPSARTTIDTYGYQKMY
tara:strand:- start:218 stop:1486 length:1269 start_codon:yes stop_codon:yes gene_type:complete